MTIFDNYEVWFVIGSQHLYGPETLRQVTQHAEHVVNALNTEAKLPCKLVLKPLGTSPDEITAICRDANYDDRCAGMVVWLHTFSPAKMWINGLTILNKPLMQFHTQFNAALPWDSIDMDFMNLNQTAHGGREFGFIGARMRQQHAVVTGHWQDKQAHERIGSWMRQAVSKQDTRHLKVCRFGDNMREVAVTDGDKVAAQIKFGFSVNTWAVGDLVQVVNAISDGEINALIDEYESTYTMTAATQVHGEKRQNVLEAARIELGMKRFLEQGGFHAFTTTFEDLHGLKQLPGLAVQRLMQQMGLAFACERVEKLNVRLFAATASTPAQLLEQGWDSKLINRLSEVWLSLPGLSNQVDDLPEIARVLLEHLVDRREVPPRRWSAAALNTLHNLSWKRLGDNSWNVLYNLVKNLALSALEEEISAEDVNRVMPSENAAEEVQLSLLPLFEQPLREARDAFEKLYFEFHLRQEQGNMTRLPKQSVDTEIGRAHV